MARKFLGADLQRGNDSKSAFAGGDGATYSETLGNGSSTQFDIAHNLDTETPRVVVNVGGVLLEPDQIILNSNTVRLKFATAPTTNQVQVEISRGTGADGPAGSGGSAALPLFKAKTDQIGTSLANTTVVLTWGAATKKDSPFAHVDGSSDITINDAGWYEFVARVQAQNDNRMELILQLHVDTTGGGFVADPDEIISDYIARDTDQDTGGLALPIQYEFSAGDVFRIVATGDADGTSSILAGTQIFGKKVA